MINTKKTLFAFAILLAFTPFLSCKTKKLPVKDITIVRQDGTRFTVSAEIAEKGYAPGKK